MIYTLFLSRFRKWFCFKTGYYRNGENLDGQRISCGSLPQYDTWYTLKVVVSRNSDAEVFVNDELVITSKTHYPLSVRGGMICGNDAGQNVRFSSFNTVIVM